jgi:glucose-1-phosphate thymidylyltransferase
MVRRKGIILAGGNGSRLYPITKATSKQLIPVYDKPMIYYPLSTLMLAGIKDILIITSPKDNENFKELLGNGSQFGITIKYKIQSKPEGIAQAFLIAEDFIENSSVTLILGDNIFHGDFFVNKLQKSYLLNEGASIFAYSVSDPERYGVVEFDSKGIAYNIEEKPKNPKSKFAITGLYFYDNTVIDKAKKIIPSNRGELEITDLNKMYMKEGKLIVEKMNRGMTWLDTGTTDSLHEASSYIRSLEKRQGLKIGCPEEVAWRVGFIDDEQLYSISINLTKSGYGKYLQTILNQGKDY